MLVGNWVVIITITLQQEILYIATNFRDKKIIY